MMPSHIALVQETYKIAARKPEQIADVFYERLFETHPELKALFPDEMTQQKMKVMKALGATIARLDQREEALLPLKDLGARHVAYGVKDAHYEAVAEALLFSLEVGLGKDWTPDVQEAWEESHALVADVMKDGAALVIAAAQGPKRRGLLSKGFLARLFR